MKRPVVGVIGSEHLAENRFPAQRVGERNLKAVADVVGALPLIFAGDPAITDIEALLETVDGVLLTGARANVHPTQFGVDEHPSYEPYDKRRDALALRLVRVCVERGVPLFGLCRGFQEMNVAFGGSLHPEIRDLPGRMNHRMPRLPTGEIHPDQEVIYGERHDVRLTPGGVFATLLGRETIRVNSLHGQGILEPGERIVVEGVAEDGTIEAIRIADAPGFALGRAMACRVRPAAKSREPRAVSGLRRGGLRTQTPRLRVRRRAKPAQAADLTAARARCTNSAQSAKQPCRSTPSAICSGSPASAKATGRRSAAWSMAARRASRSIEADIQVFSTSGGQGSRASPPSARSRTR